MVPWFLLFHCPTVPRFHCSIVPTVSRFYCSIVPTVPWFLLFHGSTVPSFLYCSIVPTVPWFHGSHCLRSKVLRSYVTTSTVPRFLLYHWFPQSHCSMVPSVPQFHGSYCSYCSLVPMPFFGTHCSHCLWFLPVSTVPRFLFHGPTGPLFGSYVRFLLFVPTVPWLFQDSYCPTVPLLLLLMFHATFHGSCHGTLSCHVAWFPHHAHALDYCGYILTTPLVIVVDTY